jgi:hypothetical protein
MPTVSTTTVRTDGVTLVELRVATTTPHRLRLDVRVEGPIWPPRDNETAQWTSGDVTLTVPSGTSGLGFATPTRPDAIEVALADADPVDDGVPTGLRRWLDAVESRVAEAERLAAADDLPAATDAVAAAGGLAAVERLAAELARDRRLLARLSFPPAELCDRAESVSLPVEPLKTVAQPRNS